MVYINGIYNIHKCLLWLEQKYIMLCNKKVMIISQIAANRLASIILYIKNYLKCVAYIT